MAKVFKHVGLWLAVLFAALCTAGLFVVHAQDENNALYQTVLGKAVNFGITASSLNHKADMQTNFAVKTYTDTGGGQGVNPNLSVNPGDFLIGHLTTRLQVTKGASKDSTFYVTEEDKSKVDDSQNISEGNHATINTTYTQDQLDGFVEDMINSALDQGGKLAKETATANVIQTSQYNDKVIIDTTKSGDDATIYVDPSSNEKCYKALSTNGNLTIKKKPNQNIVFNITTAPSSGTTLDLAKYAIETTDGQSFDTAPDSNVGDTNKRLDSQAQHIFFNVRSSGIKNVKLTNTAGIFLLQNADASVGGTSSGWIVTNKSFTNDGGEWHYIHPSPRPWSPTTTTEKTTGSLKLTKTFNGIDDASKIDLSKIKFEVKGIDSKTSSIDKKDISLTNNNGTYSAKIKNLPLGEYEVTETNADISGYKLKTTYRVGSTETQKVSLTSSDNDATVDITNDYTKKVDTGSLIFTKRTLGDAQTPDSTQFTIKGPNDNVVYQGTYSELKKTNGSVTIDNLPVGEYKVTENVDSAKVNGYTLSVKGNNSVTKVETNKTATDTITNTYSQDKGKLTFTKTFDGYNVTDQDKNNITFTVKDKDGKVVTVKDKDGNVVTEVSLGKMTKGSDGKYTYTVENLTPGDYTVTENHADSMTGYNFVQKDSVTSGKTTVTSDNTSTIDLSDVYTQKKGTLTFTKTFGGDVTKADLSNITFTITGPKDFTTQTVKLSDMTKGNDGKYTYTLDNLEWGTYTVKETNSSVNGYTLDKTSHIEDGVTVDATHLEGDANTINLTDNYSPVHPRVQLFKNEFYNGGLTGNPVGGASYALYRWKGSKASLQLFTMLTRASVDPATETDWSKVTRSDIMNSDNWEYLGEDNTDGTGFVCSKDELNEGDIVAALEVTAPAGYQRTANPAILQVHVNKAATLISDSDGAVSLDKDGNLQWKETVVRIGIKKVDANGNAVVGAKMAVLDKDGKVVDTWTTTKDNLVHETDKLIAGETYTLRELQAPEGYEKAADVTFTAEAKDIKGTDEYVQSVTMIDQKSQPAKPAQTVAQGVKTGDPTTIGGLVLMLAAAGAVLVLSAKHIKAMR
jgi:hypothetical protein